MRAIIPESRRTAPGQPRPVSLAELELRVGDLQDHAADVMRSDLDGRVAAIERALAAPWPVRWLRLAALGRSLRDPAGSR